MINTLINIISYSGIALLLFLGIKFIYERINKKKENYLKTLRVWVNLGVILSYCFVAFLSLAIIVVIPSEITKSKEQSLENLSQWIINEELKIGLMGLGIIFLLGIFGYLYQRKIEKLNLIKPIIHLTLINGMILIASLLLIYYKTYNDFTIEMEYLLQ